MITNPAKNLMTSFSRVPDLSVKKEKQEKGLLSPVRSMIRKGNTSKEAEPLLSAVKAYQQIKKDRLEILEMRKSNGSN